MKANWIKKCIKGSSMVCYICSRCNYVQGNSSKPDICPSCKAVMEGKSVNKK